MLGETVNQKHSTVNKSILLQQVYKKRNNLRIQYRGGGRFWSYFWDKNRSIYMAQCSFLVLGGPLDTGSRPSVVSDCYWFPTQCSVLQIVAFFVNLLYIPISMPNFQAFVLCFISGMHTDRTSLFPSLISQNNRRRFNLYRFGVLLLNIFKKFNKYQ